MSIQTKIIVGASSGIAKALALQLVEEPTTQLVIVSRDISFYQTEKFASSLLISIEDYSESRIASVVSEVVALGLESSISNLFICHGILHTDISFPEKKLADFCAQSFNEVVTANTLTPMLWLKHLEPIISNKQVCKIVVFSARVGSISDNRLGGWYCYRASKAALNMMLKTAAIELGRKKKGIKLVSFHPGTTDTPLSKPFQKNVAEHKLFTPAFVATQLLAVVKNTEIDGELSYLDWQGERIDW
jgi:NAD(P)-dependent dehydrogenase (short-subunit alcohol dehydrogenase family)